MFRIYVDEFLETIGDFFPNVFNELLNQPELQDVYVDLNELINLPLVGSITNDINLVVKALKENKKFTLDEEKNIIKVQLNDRTTIMLRDIPENTPHEDIKILFGEYAERITNMQPEYGNNFYVNFDTTGVTQEAFNYVRTKTFNNKNVGCCITTNYTHKTSYPYVYVPPEYQENPYPYKNYNNDYKDKKKFNNRNKRKDFRKMGTNNNSNGRGGGRPRGKKLVTFKVNKFKIWENIGLLFQIPIKMIQKYQI
jgi:hypothetical protein